MLEQFEERCLLAVQIEFEWVGDLFNDETKQVLTSAAQQITSRLTNNLAEIPIPANGAHKWTAYYVNPATGARATMRDQHIPANTLIVFVGGRSLGNEAAAETCDQFSGGPTCGLSFVADDWKDLVLNRGQAQRSTWGGSITFNTDIDWHFGLEGDAPPGKTDFVTAALHELGHLLGISRHNAVATSLVQNGSFRGACAVQAHRTPVTMAPSSTNGFHWGQHIRSNGRVASMSAAITDILGSRKHQRRFTTLDFAALVDIGWNVVPSPCGPRPKSDLIGRSLETGTWWGATSTESGFHTRAWGRWSETATWVDVSHGDFDGDGRSDVAGRVAATGDWWVARSTAAGFENQHWGVWNAQIDWGPVLVGDFNNDGLSDLAGRNAATGDWWVALSDGEKLVMQKWGRWSPRSQWDQILVGDVNGDGRDDLIGRVAATGDWWVGISDGSRFVMEKWGRWSSGSDWRDVAVGDFDGDGRADIAGRVAASGAWWGARSNGVAFHNTLWGRWSSNSNWLDVHVADFNGDGAADIAGRVAHTGDWWVAISQDGQFQNARWGRWSTNTPWLDVQAGDFDRDGRSDLVGRTQSNNALWVALSTGTQFVNAHWGHWSGLGTLVDVKVGAFADVAPDSSISLFRAAPITANSPLEKDQTQPTDSLILSSTYAEGESVSDFGPTLRDDEQPHSDLSVHPLMMASRFPSPHNPRFSEGDSLTRVESDFTADHAPQLLAGALDILFAEGGDVTVRG